MVQILRKWLILSILDIHVRKGVAWRALNSMTKCWKSNLSRNTKVRLFKATFVLIFCTYIFGISWKCHTTNLELYGDIPRYRHDDQIAHDLLFWSPLHGKCHRDRPNLSYKDVLYTDTGMTLDELKLAMMDRNR